MILLALRCSLLDLLMRSGHAHVYWQILEKFIALLLGLVAVVAQVMVRRVVLLRLVMISIVLGLVVVHEQEVLALMMMNAVLLLLNLIFEIRTAV